MSEWHARVAVSTHLAVIANHSGELAQQSDNRLRGARRERTRTVSPTKQPERRGAWVHTPGSPLRVSHSPAARTCRNPSCSRSNAQNTEYESGSRRLHTNAAHQAQKPSDLKTVVSKLLELMPRVLSIFILRSSGIKHVRSKRNKLTAAETKSVHLGQALIALAAAALLLRHGSRV